MFGQVSGGEFVSVSQFFSTAFQENMSAEQTQFEKKKGDMVARISSDVQELDHSFLSIFELIVKDPVMVLFTIISMFIISPKLSVFVIVFIPICGYVISVVGKSLRRKSLKVQKEQGNIISLVDETLSGFKILKIFNSESEEIVFNELFSLMRKSVK